MIRNFAGCNCDSLVARKRNQGIRIQLLVNITWTHVLRHRCYYLVVIIEKLNCCKEFLLKITAQYQAWNAVLSHSRFSLIRISLCWNNCSNIFKTNIKQPSDTSRLPALNKRRKQWFHVSKRHIPLTCTGEEKNSGEEWDACFSKVNIRLATMFD